MFASANSAPKGMSQSTRQHFDYSKYKTEDFFREPEQSSIKKFIEGIELDDIIIIALILLLFDDNKKDDPIILIILAVLLLT